MLAISFQPASRVDLLETYGYYTREATEEVAERFLAAVEETVAMLAQHPGLGRKRELRSPRLRELRTHSVNGFRNQLVYYLVEPSTLVVIRVLHAARDWESELSESDW